MEYMNYRITDLIDIVEKYRVTSLKIIYKAKGGDDDITGKIVLYDKNLEDVNNDLPSVKGYKVYRKITIGDLVYYYQEKDKYFSHEGLENLRVGMFSKNSNLNSNIELHKRYIDYALIKEVIDIEGEIINRYTVEVVELHSIISFYPNQAYGCELFLHNRVKNQKHIVTNMTYYKLMLRTNSKYLDILSRNNNGDTRFYELISIVGKDLSLSHDVSEMLVNDIPFRVKDIPKNFEELLRVVERCEELKLKESNLDIKKTILSFILETFKSESVDERNSERFKGTVYYSLDLFRNYNNGYIPIYYIN